METYKKIPPGKVCLEFSEGVLKWVSALSDGLQVVNPYFTRSVSETSTKRGVVEQRHIQALYKMALRHLRNNNADSRYDEILEKFKGIELD